VWEGAGDGKQKNTKKGRKKPIDRRIVRELDDREEELLVREERRRKKNRDTVYSTGWGEWE
jgi:hypothetical protein